MGQFLQAQFVWVLEDCHDLEEDDSVWGWVGGGCVES